ncbi:helix-turn-helix domain-containing protein, partial [Enterobacteriaceae bacterium H11S18]|uniref:helix-turn-helix domain-containing protein n=1 Tax=Dryocola clanedunensis TaxID=2925396 RepID=UPI0022F03E0F
MPWTETQPMQRLDFIRACQTGTEPFSALCRRFGISRKTGYKWLQRFDPDDPTSLFDKSRARLTHPDRLPPDVIQQLIDIRLTHPDWGAKKVRGWLINHRV